MLMAMLVVALGGSLGALARFSTVLLMLKVCGSEYPYGTWLVNSFGSFLAGFIMFFLLGRVAHAEVWRLFAVVGFLGAYTTFSSFSWETFVLSQDGQWLAALLNVLLNNITALVLVFLGAHCGRLVGGLP